MATLSFADAMKEPKKQWETGDSWGCWQLKLSNLTLEQTCRPWYYIDLERCRTSAAVLDWICQVAGKQWATNDVLADLVRALDDLLQPQATMCSGGMGMAPNRELGPIDVRKVLKRPHY